MPDRAEIIRYLGYKNQQPEQHVLDLIEACVAEVEAAAEPKCVSCRFRVDIKGDCVQVLQGGKAAMNAENLALASNGAATVMVQAGNTAEADKAEACGEPVIAFASKTLSRHLKDCTQVVLFAATLGIGVDRLLQKYLRLQVSKAVVVQAAAAAVLEEYCDLQCEQLASQCREQGLFVRPRYSPGYGDLSLEVQEKFLELLQAGKLAGIVLTEGGMMLPEKSVTAIVGLSPVQGGCHRAGCEMCSNTRCAYRRTERDFL